MYTNRSQSTVLEDILSRDHEADRVCIEELLQLQSQVAFKSGPSPILSAQYKARGWNYEQEMPVIEFSELSPAVLHDAIAGYGYLIVRNMIDPRTCEQLRTVIDAVLDFSSAKARSKDTFSGELGVFNDPPKNIDQLMEKTSFGVPRSFHRATGSAMCLESPSTALYMMNIFEELGLKDTLAEFFEEESALSALKWVLRRTKNEGIAPDGWHQDGAFMGADIHSLNLWMSLSECGAENNAPGLDLIPGRTRDIYASSTGKHSWQMTDADVVQDFSSPGPQSPQFGPGDAVFFDHFSIHRTQFREGFTCPRYAIESWFFAKSKCPRNQVPLAW
jgi:hypothetical protein